MFVPFADANDIAERFLSLLHRLGITPPIGSRIEDELLSLTQLIEIMKNPNLAQGQNQTSILRSAAGLYDLAAKVLSVEPLPDFPSFIPHLRLIGESRVPVASLAQNAVSSGRDDTARKMAELYVGCLAAHVGTHVELDSPTRPKGNNPDVIFTVQELEIKQPKQWALAIKTISSNQGQTIFERIKEAADQIDHPKCHADFGMIIINVKSALDHEALWNASFCDLEGAVASLGAQLDGMVASASADRPQTEWDGLFKVKVVRPIIFLGQSLVRLPTLKHLETPTTLKMLKAYAAEGSCDPVGLGLAHELNEYMQRILRGIPGSPGHLPC